jgi:hypothetical protein
MHEIVNYFLFMSTVLQSHKTGNENFDENFMDFKFPKD